MKTLENLTYKNEIKRLQEENALRYDLKIYDVLTNIEEVRKQALEKGDLSTCVKALDMQMKHLGAYTQKVEVSGNEDKAIKIECGLSPLVLAILKGAKEHREKREE